MGLPLGYNGVGVLADGLAHPVYASAVLGLVGILLAILGYKLFVWACPRLRAEEQLSRQANLAVAIVAAAMILGVCLVVAAAILKAG